MPPTAMFLIIQGLCLRTGRAMARESFTPCKTNILHDDVSMVINVGNFRQS